jgi:AraC family transcriptional regulator of adaptative response/methylated-DNA-[protein]-cysteine methyltransferase
MNDQLIQASLDYNRVEEAIRYLEAHFREQPNLDDIAASVHLSKYHFQRLFKRWAGVSPTQFLGFLTIDYAKERLAASQSVYDTSLDAGLSSAGRLHDLFVTFEAMTPGEYKRLGQDVTIRYGFHDTPFGRCLLAATPKGICALRFVATPGSETPPAGPVGPTETAALQELIREWPLATFVEDTLETGAIADRIFSPEKEAGQQPFHLFRYLIPCHRVINKSGRYHGYRWGTTRKKAILGWEAGRPSSRLGGGAQVAEGENIL